MTLTVYLPTHIIMPADIICQLCAVNKFIITYKLPTSVNRKQVHVLAAIYSPLQGAPMYT